MQTANDEDILSISKKLIDKNKEAYKVLAEWLFYPNNKYYFCTVN